MQRVVTTSSSSKKVLLFSCSCYFSRAHILRLLSSTGNRADEAKLSRISKFDKGMGALLSDVEASYESNVNNGDADYGDEDAPLQEYLLNPKTNALLTPHGSIALLER